MPTEIHVYGKPGCPLCDEALELLEDSAARFSLELVRHNILEDQALFEKYRYLVPVIVIGGIERLSLKFGPAELEAALIAAGVPRVE